MITSLTAFLTISIPPCHTTAASQFQGSKSHAAASCQPSMWIHISVRPASTKALECPVWPLSATTCVCVHHARESAVAAKCSGVMPSLFFTSLSAPASSSSFTMSVWPFHAAKCSGVMPSLSFTSLSAPASSSSFTMSVWPFSAAQCSGVLPSPVLHILVRPRIQQQLHNVSVAILQLPPKCSGVSPSLSFTSLSAPASSSSFTMSVWPFIAANAAASCHTCPSHPCPPPHPAAASQCQCGHSLPHNAAASMPSLSFTSLSAPASSSSFTMSVWWPFLCRKCSGVCHPCPSPPCPPPHPAAASQCQCGLSMPHNAAASRHPCPSHPCPPPHPAAASQCQCGHSHAA